MTSPDSGSAPRSRGSSSSFSASSSVTVDSVMLPVSDERFGFSLLFSGVSPSCT